MLWLYLNVTVLDPGKKKDTLFSSGPFGFHTDFSQTNQEE